MKSVGEVMAIGSTFQESLQKALRGLEVGFVGLDSVVDKNDAEWKSVLKRELKNPSANRLWYVADAFRTGMSEEDLFEHTKIDPWFLAEIADLVASEQALQGKAIKDLDAELWRQLKQKGFSDQRLGQLLNATQDEVREARQEFGVKPVYRRVDTCAAEFPVSSAYMYSTYEESCEADPSSREKIIVLGGGPNRIGQGLSSITVVYMQHWPCAKMGTKLLWLIVIRRRSQRITIRRIACISSR
ncbi:MAG: hypothetical protein CM15mP120_23630 [Pseudomonadota bacterium]|nr:MAG: hypothetical protein CM15mP120_23630 [Pseudomonadota bacterium]